MPTIEKFARFARKPHLTNGPQSRQRLSNGDATGFSPAHTLRRTYYKQTKKCTSRTGQTLMSFISATLRSRSSRNFGSKITLLLTPAIYQDYTLILNIKQVLDENIMGDMAELGVYRGNSAAVLAFYARIYLRRVLLFDTFEGFDQRDLVGVDESKASEFADTSLDHVRDLVGDKGVRFVQGRFPQSIPPDLYASQFCLAHIDCDLYEPAKAGLKFFYPRLSPGGLLIVHDYANPRWAGIKRAVDEYCREIPERPLVFGDKSGTVMIRKSAIT
jgi:hypothetical protein